MLWKVIEGGRTKMLLEVKRNNQKTSIQKAKNKRRREVKTWKYKSLKKCLIFKDMNSPEFVIDKAKRKDKIEFIVKYLR